MAVYKCVLQYVNYQDDWKEIFYCTQGSPGQALALFDTDFIAAALQFRAPSCYIASITVQDTQQPRSSVSRNILTSGSSGTSGLNPDQRAVTALYTLGSVGRAAKRDLFVRGLIDADTIRDTATGQSMPDNRLTLGMAGYINQMAIKQLQIQQLMPITPGVGNYQFFNLTQINVQAGGICTLTAEAAGVLTNAKRIKISLVDPKLWPGLNGTYTATNVNLPQFNIGYKSVMPVGVYPLARGHYRNVDYRQMTISNGNLDSYFVRFSSRATKTGPFAGRGAKRGVRLRYR